MSKPIQTLTRWGFVMLSGLMLSVSAQSADLQIHDPWSPEAPPGRTMAGFMTITNPTAQPITLIGGESPQFGRIEIHDMIQDQGVMRMRKLDALVIEPQSSRLLEPGSFHVMLMMPKATLVAGDVIDLSLIDDQGQRFNLQLEVRSR